MPHLGQSRFVYGSSLAFLVFVAERRGHRGSDGCSGEESRLRDGLDRLDRDAHVTSITTFSTVAFVLTDTLISAEAGIAATTTWALTIAALFALATALASRLCGKVRLIVFSRLTRHETRAYN